jgi:ferredoxin-NADP reductase
MAAALPLAECDVYVAGPAPFLEAAATALQAIDVPAGQLYTVVA